MSGLADDLITRDAVEGSRRENDQHTAAKETGSLPCAVPGASEEQSDAHTPNLGWLGVVSCVGSAVITIVCTVLIAGQLLSIGDEKMIAGDQETPPGYSVAAGFDK